MRADSTTSDLISKVNSDWINEVLANPELGRADPGNDGRANDVVDSDRKLRREFARKRAILLQRDTAKIGRRDPGITVEPMARHSRRRSVARRVTERLTLAVAAVAVVSVGAWMAPETQDVTSSASARATTASPDPTAPSDTTELRPAWLLPEILYGPARARSPISVPKFGQ